MKRDTPDAPTKGTSVKTKFAFALFAVVISAGCKPDATVSVPAVPAEHLFGPVYSIEEIAELIQASPVDKEISDGGDDLGFTKSSVEVVPDSVVLMPVSTDATSNRVMKCKVRRCEWISGDVGEGRIFSTRELALAANKFEEETIETELTFIFQDVDEQGKRWKRQWTELDKTVGTYPWDNWKLVRDNYAKPDF